MADSVATGEDSHRHFANPPRLSLDLAASVLWLTANRRWQQTRAPWAVERGS